MMDYCTSIANLIDNTIMHAFIILDTDHVDAPMQVGYSNLTVSYDIRQLWEKRALTCPISLQSFPSSMV